MIPSLPSPRSDQVLCDLRAAMAGRSPEVAEAASSADALAPAAPAGGFGRASPDALWESLELGLAGVRPFVEGSMDKWHARSSAGAAGASAGKGAFKALNQSVSQQVAALMGDPARAVRRASASLSSAPHRLVEPRNPPARGAAAEPEGDSRDLETFDDTEFYAQLLKARALRSLWLCR